MEEVNVDKTVKSKKNTGPKKVKLTYSNFFITINSNKNINSIKDEDAQHFLNIINQFFNEDFDNFIIITASKAAVNYGLELTSNPEELKKRVENVEIEFAEEIGPESQKLHVHANVKITKRGCIVKLDYNNIRKYLTEKLGYTIHFNCKLYKDMKTTLIDYMNKNKN